MKITDWECHVVETQAGIQLATRYGAPPEKREHVIVRLVTDDGEVGWGEASPLPWFTGETADTIKSVLERSWLPLLAGEDPHHIARLHDKLSGELAGNSSARAAIDIALHDVCARAAGLALADYLGGHGATTLARTYPLGIGDPKETAREARCWVRRGYSTLKLKIGGAAAESRERVQAVREAVGPDVRIRVDANAGLDLKAARQTLLALEPFDLELAEQPLPAWDREGWRALRRAVNVPLMADESLHTPQDAVELVRERSVDFLLIKLIKTGGLHRARQIAAIAEAADVECLVSTPFDTQVGAAAAVHLAFSIGSREHSHDLPPSEVEDGHTVGRVHRPRGPGIGIHEIAHSEPSWTTEATPS